MRVDWIYREECAGCHGVTGKGDGSRARVFALDVPDFNGPDFWQDATDDTMRSSVRNGKGKDMPAFGRKLAAEEIDALVVDQPAFQPALVSGRASGRRPVSGEGRG